MADFFGNKDEKDMDENKDQPQVIKLGEEEYTQSQLAEMVGLAKMAREVEEKYNTKLDRVYPEYTKATQKVKDLESQLSAKEKAELDAKANKGDELTADEIRAQALSRADEVGLVHKGNIEKYVSEYIERKELVRELDGIVEDAEKKGIKTSVQAIAEHMRDEGFRNPRKAFKDMYEEKLNAWEQEELKKVKQEGLYTENSSSGGFKLPENKAVTRDNLHDLVTEALASES